MVLPALREENLAKIEEENDKKNVMCCLAKSEREEKFKNFLKKMIWNSQRIVLKNLKYDLWLIENQVRSIKPSRGSHKF